MKLSPYMARRKKLTDKILTLNEIAHRLTELRDHYGAETLAFSRGTYRTYHWDARRFFNLFGSPNMTGANHICHCPSAVLDYALYGSMVHPDLKNTKCVVIWGAGSSESSPTDKWPALVAAKKRGAHFITVDPRYTKEAKLSEAWLPVRPGTDAALLLGWLHVIINESLYDSTFVEKCTIGFEELSEAVQDYTPAKVADITGVPAESIIGNARNYATMSPAVIIWGQGIDKSGFNSDSAIIARGILRAITGNLDIEGGECFGAAEFITEAISNNEMECNDALSVKQQQKMLGAERHRLFSFETWGHYNRLIHRFPKSYVRPLATDTAVSAHPWDTYNAMITGKPYPVKAFICQAANPLLTLADPKRTIKAFHSLDLMVVMDYYMTPTAALADFVLPAASTLERDDLTVTGTALYAHPKAMEPLFERRSDYDLWMELGRRLGQSKYWPWDSIHDVCDYRLKPVGMTFDELIEKRMVRRTAPKGRSRQWGFATPSGKVELRSSLLADYGYNPLPHFVPQSKDVKREYPLVAITGSAFQPMYHSEQRQWPTARKMRPDPAITLNPKWSETLGIEEGEWVVIETPYGRIEQRAHFKATLPEYLADIEHGWWFPEKGPDPENPFDVLSANANVLCADRPEICAPTTGAWAESGIPCRIRKRSSSLSA